MEGALPTRIDLHALLANPRAKRALMIRVIIATQAREGIITTEAQAARAYDRVQEEKRS